MKAAIDHYKQYLKSIKNFAEEQGFKLYFHEDLGFRLDGEEESHELGYNLDTVGAFLRGHQANNED